VWQALEGENMRCAECQAIVAEADTCLHPSTEERICERCYWDAVAELEKEVEE